MATGDHDELHAAIGVEAVRAAVGALRSRGERVTAPRRAVLKVLAEHSDPLSADEVAELLEDGGVHRATVYRTLDLLTDTGVVSHSHAAGGAARYHLTAAGTGHDHLHGHCRECGTVVPLPVGAFVATIARLRAVAGFTLDGDQSVFIGLCRACGAGAAGGVR